MNLNAFATALDQTRRQIEGPQLDALVKGIAIPPRPALLTAVQQELARPEPDLRRIADTVSRDAALTAAVLTTVNSPFFGLSRRIETLSQALAMLGIRQVSTLVLGLVLRKALADRGLNLTRFWDVSSKRSYALLRLAKGLGGVEPDLAQTYGLFCDVGIPLLMQRFPGYSATLQRANAEPERSFCALEHEAHDTDHALVGSLMARSWSVSQSVCLAIRLHHDPGFFSDPQVPEPVSRLVAMGLVADRAIQLHAGLNSDQEWAKAGEQAVGRLMLSDDDLADHTDDLLAGFAAGAA